MSRDAVTDIPDGGDPPPVIEFPGYCGVCGADVTVEYALQRHASMREPGIHPDAYEGDEGGGA